MWRNKKNKKSHVNWITFMFMGLLFTTEDMKELPQRNEMPSLYCTALGFFSKNEKYKLKTNE